MAIRWIEVPEYAEGSDNPPRRTYSYKFFGSIYEDVVRSYAISATPAVTSTLSSGLLYRDEISTKQIGYDSFSVRVTYAQQKREVGEWTWDFDTTGGTVKATVSKETIGARGWPVYEIPHVPTANVGDPEYYPSHKGSIDVQGDEVKGIDIVIPAMTVGVAYRHPSATVTLAYARFLEQLTGLVNSTPMLGWAPGEVLFLGARGRDGTETEAMVDYYFAMSKNTTSLTIGDITDIVKDGWHVVWSHFRETAEDVAAGSTELHGTKVPDFIYIERVYDTADLAGQLGFGE